ncbi:MAG: Mur ligase family protein [Balneolaceae bacterium]
MDTHTLFVNGAILLLCIVFLRHAIYRVRYFLQMLQQHGYKTHEYRSWLFDYFSQRVITIEHILYNVVILAMLYILSFRVTFAAGLLIMLVFALFWFGSTGRYRPDKEKKPLVVTNRVKRLLFSLALFVGPLYYAIWWLMFYLHPIGQSPALAAPVGMYWTYDPYFLGFLLVLADILIPFLIFPAAWLMKPVETSIQNGFKRQARKKLASMPHLTVVAITGSYGKTSTKFILDTFLKERFQVCTTPGSYNTPMGICKVINNDLEAAHQVLILEMGARYPGNIKELCEIAQPDLSIVTVVGLSHLESFGSVETVAHEKATLARELKPGGTLVLNGNDPVTAAMDDGRKDIRVVKTGAGGSVSASNPEISEKGTAFTLHIQSTDRYPASKHRISTPLLGHHNIDNILLSAAAALSLGVRPETIAIAAGKLQPVEHRLELKQRGALTIIDDAFNSNPVGAKNAVDVLASFSGGKRIIITPGMIELGDREEEENRTFGEHIGRSGIDLAILVGEERTRPIREGILNCAENGRPDVVTVRTLFEANELLQTRAGEGDVVLYENDLPDAFNE